MCGIAGLRLKNPDLHPRLGELVVPMLDVLTSRGPDSTGAAIYRHDVTAGSLKYSLCAPEEDYDWAGYVAALEAAEGSRPVELRRRGRDAAVVTPLEPERARRLLAELDPAVRLFATGPPSRSTRTSDPRPRYARGTACPAWPATRPSVTPGWRPSRP